jgi:hypothetical protein
MLIPGGGRLYCESLYEGPWQANPDTQTSFGRPGKPSRKPRHTDFFLWPVPRIPSRP